MAPHSSTLAWKIPWTEEPGRLQSMGSLCKPGSQHAGEKRGVAGLLLRRTERAARAADAQTHSGCCPDKTLKRLRRGSWE